MEANAIIAALRQCSADTAVCRKCLVYNQSAGCLDLLHQEAADLIERLLAERRWIPVTERLPESGKHVLVACECRSYSGLVGKYVCDGYYAAPKSMAGGCGDDCATEYDEENDEYYLLEGWYEIIKNWDDYNSIVISGFVTHWMPLPEPPKGE